MGECPKGRKPERKKLPERMERKRYIPSRQTDNQRLGIGYIVRHLTLDARFFYGNQRSTRQMFIGLTLSDTHLTLRTARKSTVGQQRRITRESKLRHNVRGRERLVCRRSQHSTIRLCSANRSRHRQHTRHTQGSTRYQHQQKTYVPMLFHSCIRINTAFPSFWGKYSTLSRWLEEIYAFSAKYFHNGAAWSAWTISPSLSSWRTSALSNTWTWMSSVGSWCCSRTFSTPVARKV